jgi:DNA-binding NarL/FixJ family response regulator
MTSAATLTGYQRRVLWLLSQGNNTTETAQIMGTDRNSVADSLAVARRRLGARSNTQAVVLAYRLGLVGVHERCGSRASYLRHIEADEDACPACKRANHEWVLRGGDLRPEPLDEAQVRLLKALHCGRTVRELALSWGLSKIKMERMISELYRRLDVTGVPRDVRREAAVRAGQERGYLAQVPPPVGPVAVRPGPDTLTPTEVLTLSVLRDRSLSQATEILGVNRSAVTTRLSNIYVKLGVSSVPWRERRGAALKEARNLGYSV